MSLVFLRSKDVKECLNGFICEVYSLDDIIPELSLKLNNYYILHLIPNNCMKVDEYGKYIDSLCSFKYVRNVDVMYIMNTLDPILIIVTPYSTLPKYFPSTLKVSECILKLYINKKYLREAYLILNMFPADIFPASLSPIPLNSLEVIGSYHEDILIKSIPREYVKELNDKWILIDYGVEGLKKCIEWFIERCIEESCRDEDLVFLRRLYSSL